MGQGVYKMASGVLKEYFPDRKYVVVADLNTWAVLGQKVYESILQAGLPVLKYIIEKEEFHADWKYVEMTDRIIEGDFDKAKALEMVQTFDLDLKQKIKTMSKGMQEKLQLLLVMCRNADIYILDEPMGGVDPAARAFILDTIMKNHRQGSTILLSTHLIYDVERVFDSILMIGRGNVLVKDTVANLTKDGKTIDDLFKEVFGYAWQVN